MIPEKDDRSTNEEEKTIQTGELMCITRGKEVATGVEEGSLKEIMGKYAEDEYGNTIMMCPQLDALELTLKLHEIGQNGLLQSAVIEQISKSNFKIHQLADWASNVLLELGSKKDKERRTMDGLDPNLISYIGLSRMTFAKARESIQEDFPLGLCRKRGLFQTLDSEPKRLAISGEIESGPDLEPTDDLLAEIEMQSQNLSQIVLTGEETSRGDEAGCDDEGKTKRGQERA